MKGANKVILNKKEKIIEVKYIGDQTYHSVQKVTEEVMGFVNELKRQNLPVLIFTDLTRLGASSSGSRTAAVEALKKYEYDKIGMFSHNLFVKYLANFIIKASGKGGKVRFFNTGKEAKRWLLNE